MMHKPSIIDYFRNLTFIVFIIGVISVLNGYSEGIILAFPYLIMEIFAILHRLLRFRTKQIAANGSSRQAKYIQYVDQHMIDFKFAAFFRRVFLLLTIGIIIKAFCGNYEQFLWIPVMLLILNIITFIKGWYIFRTYQEGSYTAFHPYWIQISQDLKYPITCLRNLKEHKRGALLGLICFVLSVAVTVVIVIYM